MKKSPFHFVALVMTLPIFLGAGCEWQSDLEALQKEVSSLRTVSALSSKQALDMGLVTRLAKHGNLENELEDYLKVFEDKSPVILRAARNSTRRGPHGADLREALHRMEKIYMDELMTSHDGVEGITAFLERRSPNWKGI